MNKNSRDHDILERIIAYCNQIEEAQVLFGRSYDVFISNST
jgi:hypothetical protein